MTPPDRTSRPLPPPTAPNRVRIVIIVLMVYAILGPPIGAIVFLGLLSTHLGMTHADPSGGASVFMFTAIFGVPFSYMIGFVPAVLTGAVFAFWQAWRGPLGFAGAGLIAVAAGGVLAVLGKGSFDDAELRSSAALIFLTGAIPTLACWALTRNVAVAPSRP